MVYSGSVAYVVRRSKQCMCMACNVVVELMMIHGNKPLNFEILVNGSFFFVSFVWG